MESAMTRRTWILLGGAALILIAVGVAMVVFGIRTHPALPPPTSTSLDAGEAGPGSTGESGDSGHPSGSSSGRREGTTDLAGHVTVHLSVGLAGPEAIRKEAQRFEIWVNGRPTGQYGLGIVDITGPPGSVAQVWLQQTGFVYPDTVNVTLSARPDTQIAQFRVEKDPTW
jgi:hypothetical protein